MKRPWHGAMPVTLTLPLGLERRPRRRRTLFKRLAIGALILGAALLAAGFWLPARAEIAQRWLERAAGGSTGDAPSRGVSSSGAALPPLAGVAIGDELAIAGAGGLVQTYEVTALDIVDSQRAELARDVDAGVIVLTTGWPFEATSVPGEWRYVVTARKRF